MTAPLPLAGVRVISLAQQYPGPFATMVLADLGADVVLVERPGTGDPARAFPGFFHALARGKRSVALDLKCDAGRAAMRQLIAGAGVLLEGFRPGTMTRLGLGPEVLLHDQPGLVYVSISGFGQTGPHRARPGHDLTYQAEAGMLYEHLPPSPPPRAPALALGDLSAGMFAVQAVLLGLVGQSRTGRGGYYDNLDGGLPDDPARGPRGTGTQRLRTTRVPLRTRVRRVRHLRRRVPGPRDRPMRILSGAPCAT